MRLPGLDEEGLHLGWGLPGLLVSGMAAVGERLGSAFAVASEPFVDGGAGDAEAVGELGDGVEALGVEGDEASALDHGVGRGKGHRLRIERFEEEPCKLSARSEV